MQYLEPVIGFLAFLGLLIGSLLAGRFRRKWQCRAEACLALSGMSFFGLILYELVHTEVRYSFRIPKALLGGIAIGICLSLWLEGSYNVVRRLREKGQPSSAQ